MTTRYRVLLKPDGKTVATMGTRRQALDFIKDRESIDLRFGVYEPDSYYIESFEED